MNMKIAAALASLVVAYPAHGATVVVQENSAAPTSNFGSPTNQATVGYTIQLGSDASNVTGILTTSNASALPFANLYFDLDYLTRAGSDLGFELNANGGNMNAFVPGVSGSASVGGITTSFVGGVFTFAIPKTYFTSAIAGLSYNPALTFGGDTVRLNLSQSFSYSVAGGQAFYGSDRLGIASVAAVPEPATWAMLIVGFGLIGGAVRAGRRGSKPAFAAA